MGYSAEVVLGDGKVISFETGKIAKQADGAVIVRSGGSIVLSTATAEKQTRHDVDFFPLNVDYREKAYAAGKIPGGYFKREGRPADKETLTGRLIDRPIRPLFPDGFRCSTHIVNFVLSHDQVHEPDVLAILGSATALMISDIPFLGPISPVRVGRIDGRLIAFPTYRELETSDLNLTVVCSETAIVMVEGEAYEIPESIIIEALEFAFEKAQILNAFQRNFREKVGKEKRELEPVVMAELLKAGLPVDTEAFFAGHEEDFLQAIQGTEKMEVARKLSELNISLKGAFDITEPEHEATFNTLFRETERRVARRLIVNTGKRNDGRAMDQIRKITSEVDLLPATHGSALFTRGQTQALVTLTLGTTLDEQKIDDLEGETFKSFMLHYNFPPFSVGEAGFLRSPGRREIGHGNLAERAIKPMLPQEEDFPYTVRIVSDIMESNGSSSMATVCGATLCLMDGGVPIKSPVAGIAMGLITENDNYAVLSDISGMEDHLGDMDFKVAGTRHGITAIQMDIKLTGFRFEILQEALEQARKGRIVILDKMADTLTKSREELKPHAPRIHLMKINPEKIAKVIGPGGKMIRSLTAETGATIEIEDDGTVKIFSANLDSLRDAVEKIKLITEDAEIGKDYWGTVNRIEPYGAFIEILPGVDGLLHVSRMANYRVENVTDEMNLGDRVLVRVADIDTMGKIKLTREELMREGRVEGKKPSETKKQEPNRPRRYPKRDEDRRHSKPPDRKRN